MTKTDPSVPASVAPSGQDLLPHHLDPHLPPPTTRATSTLTAPLQFTTDPILSPSIDADIERAPVLDLHSLPAQTGLLYESSPMSRPPDDPSSGSNSSRRGRGSAHPQGNWQSFAQASSTYGSPHPPQSQASDMQHAQSQPPQQHPPPTPSSYASYPTSPSFVPSYGYMTPSGYVPYGQHMLVQPQPQPQPYPQPQDQTYVPGSPPLYQTGPAGMSSPNSPTTSRPPRLQQAHSQQAYGMVYSAPMSPTYSYGSIQGYATSPYQQSFPQTAFQPPPQGQYAVPSSPGAYGQQQYTPPDLQDPSQGQQQPQPPPQQTLPQQQGGWWFMAGHPMSAHGAQGQGAPGPSPYVTPYANFGPPPDSGLSSARSLGQGQGLATHGIGLGNPAPSPMGSYTNHGSNHNGNHNHTNNRRAPFGQTTFNGSTRMRSTAPGGLVAPSLSSAPSSSSDVTRERDPNRDHDREQDSGNSNSGKRVPAVRKPYHPRTPQNRSEWVMWAGNVPADASEDELWALFTSSPTAGPSGPGGPGVGFVSGMPTPMPIEGSDNPSGVTSLHLIARSNCAFVNFASQEALLGAVKRFDGCPARMGDPRCPRLVCRVRRREDDLKAGVGAQRGTGVHTKWVKDNMPSLGGEAVVGGEGDKKKEEEQEEQEEDVSGNGKDKDTATSLDGKTRSGASTATAVGGSSSGGKTRTISFSEQEHMMVDGKLGAGKAKARHQSSGSDSYASTDSSLLGQHFPRRYFILKSLSQHDVDLSVENGLWATQKHNEGILDRAYRTAAEVYLIFGVNKSGEFYGYAKMAGPIHGERRVSWASTSSAVKDSETEGPPDSPGAGLSSLSHKSTSQNLADRRVAELASETYFFSPSEGRTAENSPLPMPSSAGSRADSAPGFFAQATVGKSEPMPKSVDRERLFVRNHTATDPFPVSPGLSETETLRGGAPDVSSAPAAVSAASMPLPILEQTSPTPPDQAAAQAAEQAAGEVLPPPSVVQEAVADLPRIELDPTAPIAAAARASNAARSTTPALRPIHEDHPTPHEERRRTAPAGMPDSDSGTDAPERTESSPMPPADNDGVKRYDTLELEKRRGSAPGTAPRHSGSNFSPAAPIAPIVASPGGEPVATESGPSTHGGGAGGSRDSSDMWGSSFKIEWLRTERLPFWRTRHLRNPWNQDREVKVSRDGTEVEPSIGQRLLDEWDAPAPVAPPMPQPSPRRARPPAGMKGPSTPGGRGTPAYGGMPMPMSPLHSLPRGFPLGRTPDHHP